MGSCRPTLSYMWFCGSDFQVRSKFPACFLPQRRSASKRCHPPSPRFAHPQESSGVSAPEANPRACPTCHSGRLGLKLSSKTAAFIGCSNYPSCTFVRSLATVAGGGEGGGKGAGGGDSDEEDGGGEEGAAAEVAEGEGDQEGSAAPRQEERLRTGQQLADELGVKGESWVGRG